MKKEYKNPSIEAVQVTCSKILVDSILGPITEGELGAPVIGGAPSRIGSLGPGY